MAARSSQTPQKPGAPSRRATFTDGVDGLAAKQRLQVAWNGLGYSVATKRDLDAPRTADGEKIILHDCCGHASPGKLLAVMGSSGAGKTTLLNCLAGRRQDGTLSGEIRVNGQLLATATSAAFRRATVFVTQDDLMMSTQTVREVLTFSAALRLPQATSAAARDKLVASVIQTLHLERTADTMIGEPAAAGGVSGGERKRVNIGAELVTNPSVLFVDEPTSGLDAYTAAQVVTTLTHSLARSGRTVVATIHQPASEVFTLFDDLCLLHKGGVAYFGPAKDALGYFGALGATCPMHFNPADFLINTLMRQLHGDDDNGNDGDAAAQQQLSGPALPDFVAAFASSGAPRAASATPPALDGLAALRPDPAARASSLRALRVLFGRTRSNYSRNRLGLKARLAQTLLFSTIAGLIFYDLGEDLEGIQSRQGFIFFVLLNNFLVAVLNVVLIFPPERRIFEREFDAGYYKVRPPASTHPPTAQRGTRGTRAPCTPHRSPLLHSQVWPYYVARISFELPIQAFFPVVFMAVAYHLAGMRAGAASFWQFVGVTILMTQTASGLGILVGCIVPTPELAVTMVPPMIIPFILTGGLLANNEQLKPWVWLKAASPVAYGYEAGMLLEFKDRVMQFNRTASLCSAAAVGVNMGRDVADTAEAAARRAARRYNGSSTVIFYGNQLLREQHMVCDDPDASCEWHTVWFNCLMLVLLFLVFRLLALTALLVRCYPLQRRRGGGGAGVTVARVTKGSTPSASNVV